MRSVATGCSQNAGTLKILYKTSFQFKDDGISCFDLELILMKSDFVYADILILEKIPNLIPAFQIKDTQLVLLNITLLKRFLNIF